MNKVISRIPLIGILVFVLAGLVAQAATNSEDLLFPFAMERFEDTQDACDPTGGANPEWPPCETNHDNECFTGGQMEGRCITDFDWEMGWWLARFNQGHVTRDDVPEAFQSGLPPEITPSVDDQEDKTDTSDEEDPDPFGTAEAFPPSAP